MIDMDIMEQVAFTEEEAKELKHIIPQYAFYEKKRSSVRWYCSCCEKWYEERYDADDLYYEPIPRHIVRFPISNDTSETIITNLDADRFPPSELKQLYAMRWGIETSFRDLKYTVGLQHFHAKKTEFVQQEIFARLTMYNFYELITQSVVIQQKSRKYPYKVNFSAAVHICREFFLHDLTPSRVEALLTKFISPVRPGRSSPRKLKNKHPFGFTYRVA